MSEGFNVVYMREKRLGELLWIGALGITANLLSIWPVMRLWDRLAAPMFHVPIVTYIQALGLITLLKMLTYRRTTTEPKSKSTGDHIIENVGFLVFWYLMYWVFLLAAWLAR